MLGAHMGVVAFWLVALASMSSHFKLWLGLLYLISACRPHLLWDVGLSEQRVPRLCALQLQAAFVCGWAGVTFLPSLARWAVP